MRPVAGGAGDAGGPWAGLFSLLMEHGAGERDLELGFPVVTFSALAVAAGTLGPGTPQLLITETVPGGGGLVAAGLRGLPGPLPLTLCPLSSIKSAGSR